MRNVLHANNKKRAEMTVLIWKTCALSQRRIRDKEEHHRLMSQFSKKIRHL